MNGGCLSCQDADGRLAMQKLVMYSRHSAMHIYIEYAGICGEVRKECQGRRPEEHGVCACAEDDALRGKHPHIYSWGEANIKAIISMPDHNAAAGVHVTWCARIKAP